MGSSHSLRGRHHQAAGKDLCLCAPKQPAACSPSAGGVVPTGTLQYLMMQYLTTVHDLLCHKVFSQHAHALTSSPEQQHVIAAALLRWALPALATAVEAAGRTAGSGAAEWLSLSHCGPPGPARADTPEPPSVLSLLCECLEPTAAAVSGMLLGPDGSALVQQAGRLLRALLLDPPPGLAPAALLSSQADAANIATFLCFRMIDQMEGAGSGQGSSSRATAIAREQRQAAAWELLCLLPHLLVVLQDQAAQHQHGQAALTCHRLELAVQLVYGEKDILRVGSFQEAADLLASSEAAARLAPVLVRLASDRQPQAPPSVSRAPAVVLSSLIRLVWHNSGAYILQSMGG
ncbi:hypothetical protein ABPG75_006846 [Micractinium tetrahymenae]